METTIDGTWVGRAPTVHIQHDMIDVTSFIPKMQPDPAWQFVDEAGHFHAFTLRGELPTIETKYRRVSCADQQDCNCDGYDEAERVCRICGEEIAPGYEVVAPPGEKEFIPGQVSWRVTDVPVDGATPLFGLVSVRCRSDDGAHEYFGIAQVTTYAHHRELVGVGELGKRAAVG